MKISGGAVRGQLEVPLRNHHLVSPSASHLEYHPVKLARAVLPDGTIAACRIDDTQVIPLIVEGGGEGESILRAVSGGELVGPGIDPVPVADVRFLSPLSQPSKILAVGLNYKPHASEVQLDIPENPLLFSKYPSCLVGHGDAIRYRTADTTNVDYEAELAVVIGKVAHRVAVDDALDHVFGYTACNDVSARDVQFADVQWVRGKSFDTFCPLGPWVVTADEIPDPQDLEVSCVVNGETLQQASTSDMIFGVAEIISYFSQTMTLLPGDVIATGTPAGVGYTRTPPVFLRDGDSVSVTVERVGTLTNAVLVET
ncbi:fumarylacetoacetate hydrolase family protein [Actinomycetospora sp. C-140]